MKTLNVCIFLFLILIVNLTYATSFKCDSEKTTSRIICKGGVITTFSYVYIFNPYLGRGIQYLLSIEPIDDKLMIKKMPRCYDDDGTDGGCTENNILNYFDYTYMDETDTYFRELFLQQYPPHLFSHVTTPKKELPDLVNFKLDYKKLNGNYCVTQGFATVELKSFYLYVGKNSYQDEHHVLDYRVLKVKKPSYKSKCSEERSQVYEQLLNALPPSGN